MQFSCCLKNDMLVCVTSTPSSTVTEDSLCQQRFTGFICCMTSSLIK